MSDQDTVRRVVSAKELAEVVRKHGLWLKGDEGGVRADLSNCDLDRASLNGASLDGASLDGASLNDASLNDASLNDASLNGASLDGASLNGASLDGASLDGASLNDASLNDASLNDASLNDASLNGASLNDASLNDASLNDASLNRASLNRASLNRASLNGASLDGASLNDASGVLDPVEWLKTNFQSDELGIVVFKRIGAGQTQFAPPERWVVAPGSFITEVVNPERTTDCGSGVNFGTHAWCTQHYIEARLWKCRIRWIDLAGVVVPFGTTGKARCGRLELLEIIQ